ncbi:MAG TPA: GNVR domain-containing protein, partial [Balneolaceae bacterium]|nr:GNVR domain-containing protein [Balneolaceae bacterium]
LNKYQLKIIKAMRRHLNLKIDDEDGLVTLTVTMPDARAAAETGHAAIELLNKYVTDYRTHQAVQYLDFVEKQTEQARQDFYEIQTKLAVFQDQNINPATAKAKIQLKRLESKNNLLFNLYNSLEQQLEQAKFKVQQKTPVITVLEPVKVPVDNYKPQKKLIIIVALLVGLILSVFYITTRSILQGRETSIVK